MWLAYWSAESGASLPWSKTWQDKLGKAGSEVPEIVLALTIAGVSAWGNFHIFDTGVLATISVFIVSAIIAYAGKQSATRAYLQWETHNDSSDRKSTLRFLYRILAKPFGWVSGDEGYAWIVAFVKGFIITAGMGGLLGGLLYMLGHELGSHAKGRLAGDPNMWKELISGFGLDITVVLYVLSVLYWFT